MSTKTVARLHQSLRLLRSTLAPNFQPDTAVPGTSSSIASAGHCAAVAAIVYLKYGGALVSTTVEGQSHWFNRLRTCEGELDVDLTGDQFGLPPLQISERDGLYSATRVRTEQQLNADTLRRARLLSKRAHLDFVSEEIERVLHSRHDALAAA